MRSGAGARLAGALVMVALVTGACADGPSAPIDGEPSDTTGTPVDTLPIPLAGGETTVFDVSPDAYTKAAPNLTSARAQQHISGRLSFRAPFVPAPADDQAGLGPLFNDLSCEACHTRASRAPQVRLLRLSGPGTGAHGEPAPAPSFGTQLQDRAVEGFEPEARIRVTWTAVAGTYPDGTPYELRHPTVTVERPYTGFAPTAQGLRAPRPLFGLGLLEAVEETTLEALADPDDADGDGVSGELNRVWDLVTQSERVGRFGWKAEQPSLLQQTDAAYLEDMGVTTSLYPVEATAGQQGGEDGLDDDPELDDQQVDDVVFYIRTLGVPARRDVNDAQVREGEALFTSLGCAACHVPSLTTGTLEGVPEVSGQTIFPYTDMLLHDMGDGLADGRPVYRADGREWRTPPLWGLGLAEAVLNASVYLHDGRARTVEEAVLWHGGEAQAARDAFVALAASARAALLEFLASL